jgi:ATP-dependent Clp protease protease subunit
MVPNLEQLFAMDMQRRALLEQEGSYFLGAITDEEAERFSKAILVMSLQRQQDTNVPLKVFVNSGGGSVGAGLAIMEMMGRMRREYGVKINTIVTGYAYSMGGIILQAGDTRIMGPFSTVMLHGGYWQLAGEDEKIFKDYVKLAEHYQKLIGGLFARRTAQHDQKWWTDFIYSGHDKFLSASECLELGLVDRVEGMDDAIRP